MEIDKFGNKLPDGIEINGWIKFWAMVIGLSPIWLSALAIILFYWYLT